MVCVVFLQPTRSGAKRSIAINARRRATHFEGDRGGLVAVNRTRVTNIDLTPIRLRCNRRSFSLLNQAGQLPSHSRLAHSAFHGPYLGLLVLRDRGGVAFHRECPAERRSSTTDGGRGAPSSFEIRLGSFDFFRRLKEDRACQLLRRP